MPMLDAIVKLQRVLSRVSLTRQLSVGWPRGYNSEKQCLLLVLDFVTPQSPRSPNGRARLP